MTFIRNSTVALAQNLLTRTGAALPPKMTHGLRRAASLVEVGHWMKSSGYKVSGWAQSREVLWQEASRDLAEKKTLYLEFGVWDGRSMRYWSDLLKHPQARLQGFDSFEGLPEAWRYDYPKGSFDVGGKIPIIEDNRVEFFKGWFDQTLRNHEFPPHESLFINCDADLYSSSKIVLDSCAQIIRPGAYLYFDEFNDYDHELRAFHEFLAETGMKVALVGATAGFHNAMFIRTD